MEQCKCWTGRGCGRAQSRDETFDELRFATTEAASKRKDVARFDLSRELPPERFGFVRAIGNERSHEAEVEKASY